MSSLESLKRIIPGLSFVIIVIIVFALVFQLGGGGGKQNLPSHLMCIDPILCATVVLCHAYRALIGPVLAAGTTTLLRCDAVFPQREPDKSASNSGLLSSFLSRAIGRTSHVDFVQRPRYIQMLLSAIPGLFSRQASP